LILPLYPSLAPIYTPDVRARIAATWAPVAQKYNLTLGALGPELVFAATVLPLIAPTVQAIRTDRAAAQKAKPAADAPADAAAPAAPVVDDAPFKNYVPIVAPVQLAA
jgi:hypothetical protein